jgi:catechol 2,3-dioxygenase-like lactoylglutathione lyase family enzyme
MRPARIAALAIALLAFAVEPAAAPAQQAPPLAGIAHVALRVKNLAASIAFYQSLGFVQAFDLRHDDVPYESFIKINDHQFIELYPVTDKDPQPAFLHVCFEGDDLESIHADYISHGLTPTAVRKAGAGNMLFTMPGPPQPIGPDFKPLPQNIEYTEYEPGSLHSNDAGLHLGGDRIADRLLGVALAEVDADSARMFYINQLSFKPLPGEPMVMHLPGNSGDEIEIVPAALGQHARITLQSASLGRSGRRLSHEHINFKKSEESLFLTDPDGNQIFVRQR